MENDFDDFVNKLQQKIFEDTREAYGEVAFEHWQNPIYQGEMENPDGHARITGKCGDTMEIFLKFHNDRTQKALYQTDGCGSSMVCGSIAAEMAIGKSPDELLAITGEAILKKLGRFPKEDEHCAFLAAVRVSSSTGYAVMVITTERISANAAGRIGFRSPLR